MENPANAVSTSSIVSSPLKCPFEQKFQYFLKSVLPVKAWRSLTPSGMLLGNLISLYLSWPLTDDAICVTKMKKKRYLFLNAISIYFWFGVLIEKSTVLTITLINIFAICLYSETGFNFFKYKCDIRAVILISNKALGMFWKIKSGPSSNSNGILLKIDIRRREK